MELVQFGNQQYVSMQPQPRRHLAVMWTFSKSVILDGIPEQENILHHHMDVKMGESLSGKATELLEGKQK